MRALSPAKYESDAQSTHDTRRARMREPTEEVLRSHTTTRCEREDHDSQVSEGNRRRNVTQEPRDGRDSHYDEEGQTDRDISPVHVTPRYAYTHRDNPGGVVFGQNRNMGMAPTKQNRRKSALAPLRRILG